MLSEWWARITGQPDGRPSAEELEESERAKAENERLREEAAELLEDARCNAGLLRKMRIEDHYGKTLDQLFGGSG